MNENACPVTDRKMTNPFERYLTVGVGWCIGAGILLGKVAPGFARTGAMVDKLVWGGVFEGRFEDPEFAQQRFAEHIEDVKSVVPAERHPVCACDCGAPMITHSGQQRHRQKFTAWISAKRCWR